MLPYLSEMQARMQMEELRRQAEHARLVRAVRPARGLRLTVGAWLVALGHQITPVSQRGVMLETVTGRR